MVTPKKGFSKDKKDSKKLIYIVTGFIGYTMLVGGSAIGLTKLASSKYPEENKTTKQTESEQYQNYVDSTYKSIVNENVDDTSFFNLLNKYVPFSEKEKVVKQNKLEKNLGKEIKISAE